MTIKKLAMAVMVTASVVLAGIENENFRQLTTADLIVSNDGSQFWFPADGFSLKVPAHTQVWISNIIKNWSCLNQWNQSSYPDLVDENVYQMTTDKFGYYTVDNGVLSDFHSGTTETMILTYTNDQNNNQSSPTTGYLLGKFDEDTEIFLAMTPVGSNEMVNSYQEVRDVTQGINTTLKSRVWQVPEDPNDPENTNVIPHLDIAGNIRMNWGFDGLTPSGREFTIAYEDLDFPDTPTGQPLPGVLFSGLLLMGTVGTAKRIRRRQTK
jgi:hypothetical protein